MLQLLQSHGVQGGIMDLPELDEAERHLHYLFLGESFSTGRKDILDKKSVKKSGRMAHFTPIVGPHGLLHFSG